MIYCLVLDVGRFIGPDVLTNYLPPSLPPSATSPFYVGTKARAWIAGGSSDSNTALWPTVVQDAFEERLVSAAAEARLAAAGALSTRQELEALSSEFAKYKARAHTALKKATSSGADDKRKDEVGWVGGGVGGWEGEACARVVLPSSSVQWRHQ